MYDRINPINFKLTGSPLSSRLKIKLFCLTSPWTIILNGKAELELKLCICLEILSKISPPNPISVNCLVILALMLGICFSAKLRLEANSKYKEGHDCLMANKMPCTLAIVSAVILCILILHLGVKGGLPPTACWTNFKFFPCLLLVGIGKGNKCDTSVACLQTNFCISLTTRLDCRSCCWSVGSSPSWPDAADSLSRIGGRILGKELERCRRNALLPPTLVSRGTLAGEEVAEVEGDN